MLREVLESMRDALTTEESLPSTYCIHKALRAGSRGRARLPGIYSIWPGASSSDCQTVQLGSGNSSCRWFGPPGHALVSPLPVPSADTESHPCAFPWRGLNILGFSI